ncbi:MAG: hypothetical protein ACXVHI_01935 [Frankiaceae bacterium]
MPGLPAPQRRRWSRSLLATVVVHLRDRTYRRPAEAADLDGDGVLDVDRRLAP